jgi:hypothetical protein
MRISEFNEIPKPYALCSMLHAIGGLENGLGQTLGGSDSLSSGIHPYPNG